MIRSWHTPFVLTALFLSACAHPTPNGSDSGPTDSGQTDAGMTDAGMDAGTGMDGGGTPDGGSDPFAGTFSGTDTYTFSMCSGSTPPAQMFNDTFTVTQSGDMVSAVPSVVNCTITATATGDTATINPVTCVNNTFELVIDVKTGTLTLSGGTLTVNASGTADFGDGGNNCNLAISGSLPKTG